MAELATIARPYAEAMFKAVGGDNAAALASQLEAIGQVAGDAQLRQFADNPKVSAQQVFDLVSGVAKTTLSPKIAMPGGLPVLDQPILMADEIKMPVGRDAEAGRGVEGVLRGAQRGPHLLKVLRRDFDGFAL